MVPATKYAQSGQVNIAYQVVGDGPLDLVLVPEWVSNIDVLWEEPRLAHFLRQLSGFSRLILFDKRGTGLSDRVTDTPMLEERMDDVRAVMDAVGSKRAALLGYSEGGPNSRNSSSPSKPAGARLLPSKFVRPASSTTNDFDSGGRGAFA